MTVKIRHKKVGIDTYELQIKKDVFGFWTTIYDGNKPLKVTLANLNSKKVEILAKYK